MFESILLTVGFLKLAQMLWTLSVILRRHNWLRPVKSEKLAELTKRYEDQSGRPQWALVTGASDGIGAAYATVLADIGFNVVLVSRTESKLRKVAEGLNPKVQSKIIIADFGGSANIEFYEGIRTQVKDLNITVCVVNAGLIKFAPFVDTDTKVLQDLVDVNVYHVAMMSKLFLPVIAQRTGLVKKGALIVNSSVSCHSYMPSALTYSATKAFATSLTKSLAYENKAEGSPLDVQCLCPFATESNIVKNKEFKLIATPATKVARISLQQLMRPKPDCLCYGTLANELMGRCFYDWFANGMPWLFNALSWNLRKIVKS